MPRMYRIQEIEGIGPSHGAKLEAAGIRTTENLLARAAAPRERIVLSQQTGVTATQILRWCNQADLMRIPGVGRQYSELLEASGVDTVKELAQRNPDNLVAQMRQVNESRTISRTTPSLSSARMWIERARTTKPTITY